MQKQWLLTLAGPLLAAAGFFWGGSQGYSTELSWTLAVTFWCVFWWVSEPLPIPVTSLLPIALFPLTGVLSAKEVAQAYGNPLILLLLGGCLLSVAMSSTGTHRRIALGMVGFFGKYGPRGVVFGFMVASAFLSMWISNTATALVLLPVALAVVDRYGAETMALPLLLGIAFAASIGGVGTPIGTPPNLVFIQVYKNTTGIEVPFSQWMSWALPVIVVFLPIMAWWLTRNLRGSGTVDIQSLGPWRNEEKRVLIIFALTALAWITRKEPFGGWSGWLGLPGANDASVALLAVIAMFAMPKGDGSNNKLLTWQDALAIPWGVLLLFAGGLCIATAFNSSGLSDLIGQQLAGIGQLPTFAMILLICLLVTFLTEVTSNTASTTLLMPILAAAAAAAGVEPRLLMVPAAMSASCAFMLPVATAPNAVVFGSGYFTVKQMAREGFILNIVGALCISGMCYVLL